MERVQGGMNMEMLDLVRILCKKKIECMTIQRSVHKNISREIPHRTADSGRRFSEFYFLAEPPHQLSMAARAREKFFAAVVESQSLQPLRVSVDSFNDIFALKVEKSAVNERVY